MLNLKTLSGIQLLALRVQQPAQAAAINAELGKRTFAFKGKKTTRFSVRRPLAAAAA